MITSSRNPSVRLMAERDGDEETKAYVKSYYDLPAHLNSWPEIDDAAEASQKHKNAAWAAQNK